MSLSQPGYADPLSQAQYDTQRRLYGRVDNMNGTGPGWGGTSYSGPAVSNGDITSWLAAHPNAGDSDIAAAMDQYGVSVGQMAGATGLPIDQVYARYNAVEHPGDTSGAWGGQQGGATTYGSGTSQNGQLNYGGFYQAPGAAGGAASSGSPAGSVDLQAYSQNPYLAQMGTDLQGQFNRNLTQNTLPSLRGGAVAAGGVGGSRQGIAEGLAAGASNTGADNAITSLYGNDYEQQMGRNLQQYGMDQNFALGNGQLALGYAGQANAYDLGRRGIDLGYQNSNNAFTLGNKTADQNYSLGQQGLDNSFYLGNQGQMQNFYDANRGMDIQTAALGGNLTTAGNSGSWSGLQDANGIYNNYTGYGTSGSTTSTGTDLGRGLGSGLGTYQYGSANGWW
jgi:hypothetical protein